MASAMAGSSWIHVDASTLLRNPIFLLAADTRSILILTLFFPRTSLRHLVTLLSMDSDKPASWKAKGKGKGGEGESSKGRPLEMDRENKGNFQSPILLRDDCRNGIV